MPLTTTATTGSIGLNDKNSIAYSVGLDLAPAADTTTRGHTVTLTCRGEDEELFLWDMIGYSEIDEDGNLHRVLPERSGSDGSSSENRLYAVSYQPGLRTPKREANGDLALNFDGWPMWDEVSFNFSFVAPLYRVKEDDEVTHEHERFCIWRKKMVSQNEKIPGGTYRFVDDAVEANRFRLNEVGVRTGSVLELTCQWVDVPRFDFKTFNEHANTVNSTTVTWDGAKYEAETVLFVGADEVPRTNALGDPTRDINLSFLIRIDGRTWNRFWNKASGAADKYTLVTDTGLSDGNRVFARTALDNIWTFS